MVRTINYHFTQLSSRLHKTIKMHFGQRINYSSRGLFFLSVARDQSKATPRDDFQQESSRFAMICQLITKARMNISSKQASKSAYMCEKFFFLLLALHHHVAPKNRLHEMNI